VTGAVLAMTEFLSVVEESCLLIPQRSSAQTATPGIILRNPLRRPFQRN
jgi:hypothetical protein